MSSKLVFLDIDGTLADERHEVPISAQEACKAARSRGHKLFICTGRSMPKIERGILDLGFDGVISVAANAFPKRFMECVNYAKAGLLSLNSTTALAQLESENK